MKKYLCLLLVLVMTLSAFVTPVSALTADEELLIETYMRDIRAMLTRFLEAGILTEASLEELLQWALYGIVSGSGDPWAAYFTDEDLSDFMTSITGSGVGYGIQVEANADWKPELITIYPDSPAAKAGLKVGDVLLTVNGKDLTFDDMTALPKDNGAEAVFTVQRGAELLTVTVIVGPYTVPTVEYEMLENKIGYIKITSVTDATPKQALKAMVDLRIRGMKQIVLDLRDNPGGTVGGLMGLARLFMGRDVVFYEEYKDGTRNEHRVENPYHKDFPLAVLVNGGTASAAEILTAALQDHREAIVVGTENTYGKCVGQETTYLPFHGALKLTTMRVVTPAGRNFQEEGLTPDILVEKSENEDAVLNAAVDWLLENPEGFKAA